MGFKSSKSYMTLENILSILFGRSNEHTMICSARKTIHRATCLYQRSLSNKSLEKNKWSQYMGEIEYFFYCPYCGENISMLIDLNHTNQLYTEDCEVCCRPIEIDFTVVEGTIESWEASRSD